VLAAGPAPGRPPGRLTPAAAPRPATPPTCRAGQRGCTRPAAPGPPFLAALNPKLLGVDLLLMQSQRQVLMFVFFMLGAMGRF